MNYTTNTLVKISVPKTVDNDSSDKNLQLFSSFFSLKF